MVITVVAAVTSAGKIQTAQCPVIFEFQIVRIHVYICIKMSQAIFGTYLR